jgi:two-component system sensor histidine kinase KdpD
MRYVAAVSVVVVATLLGFALFGRNALTDVVMIYLLGNVVVSTRFGFRASITCGIASVVAFDFFFTEPYFTLGVSDLHHVVTFGVMLLVGIVIATLTERVRDLAKETEVERLRSTLLSSVSHDLRTPLAVIRGAASAIMDDDDMLEASSRRELASAIVEETERLDRQVRNLLDMTRLESGAVTVKKEWQPMQEVIGSAWNRMEPRLVGRAVNIDVGGELEACFDGVLVEQLIVNLLENAAKYTPEGTPIDVRAAKKGHDVVVTVEDRGPGIAAEDRERIFDKFRTKSGIGLGLAICRAIASTHGGRVWVEERAGGGAAFHFSLPEAA